MYLLFHISLLLFLSRLHGVQSELEGKYYYEEVEYDEYPLPKVKIVGLGALEKYLTPYQVIHTFSSVCIWLSVFVVFTVCFVGGQRLSIYIELWSNNKSLWWSLVWSTISLRSYAVDALTMINSKKVKEDLRLNRELTSRDLSKIMEVFKLYRENIEKQGNERMIQFLKFNLMTKQQQFMTLLGISPLYSQFELTHQLAKILKKLKMKPTTASKIGTVHSTAGGGVPKSTLDAKTTDRMQNMMAGLASTITEDNLDPKKQTPK